MQSSGSFQIIGHRGAAGIEPENTLRSFARALAIGVDAIELDVYCVEGKLVVIHDDTLERTTSGRGKVMATSFAVLRTLDAGQGERIPTLEEVLDLIAGRVMVNVELKGAGTAEAVAACIAAHGGTEVLVSSFDHGELARFRAVSRRANVAPLFHRATPTMFDTAGALDAWAINLSAKVATGERLRAIADHGYRSFVYTVNDPIFATALKADGATGVFTDFPDRMQALRA